MVPMHCCQIEEASHEPLPLSPGFQPTVSPQLSGHGMRRSGFHAVKSGVQLRFGGVIDLKPPRVATHEPSTMNRKLKGIFDIPPLMIHPLVNGYVISITLP